MPQQDLSFLMLSFLIFSLTFIFHFFMLIFVQLTMLSTSWCYHPYDNYIKLGIWLNDDLIYFFLIFILWHESQQNYKNYRKLKSNATDRMLDFKTFDWQSNVHISPLQSVRRFWQVKEVSEKLFLSLINKLVELLKVIQYLFGLRHAFYLRDISWDDLNVYFACTINTGLHPFWKSLIFGNMDDLVGLCENPNQESCCGVHATSSASFDSTIARPAEMGCELSLSLMSLLFTLKFC